MIMGTPSYMSPEQSLGSATKIGPATDAYSLGAILYETLVGRPPFEAMYFGSKCSKFCFFVGALRGDAFGLIQPRRRSDMH